MACRLSGNDFERYCRALDRNPQQIVERLETYLEQMKVENVPTAS
jgi:hypothetical protein